MLCIQCIFEERCVAFFFILLSFIFIWHIWQIFFFVSWKKNLLQQDKSNLKKKRKKKKIQILFGSENYVNWWFDHACIFYLTKSKNYACIFNLLWGCNVCCFSSRWNPNCMMVRMIVQFCCLWLSEWWWTSFWDWDVRFLQSQGKNVHFQFFIMGMIHDIHL